MTKQEAEDLAIDVRKQTGSTKVLVIPIGNREWVVWFDYAIYIWGQDDWQKLQERWKKYSIIEAL